MRFLLSVLVFVSASGLAGSEVTAPGHRPEIQDSFPAAVQKHISAISVRDLETLLTTITDDERQTLVFPDGTTLYTRQEYVAFHFARENGEWRLFFDQNTRIPRAD